MKDSDLTKLRRARARVHHQINLLEPLLDGYRAKLADLEAQIHALAPELNLPPRRYKPNPYFVRGELPRLVLAILRDAGQPLSTREIAVRALATKGVTLPDRRALKLTRLRVCQACIRFQERGITGRVGSGNRGKRVLCG